MKRILILFAIAIGILIIRLDIFAVPAYPYPVTFTQPDGSALTITLKGDENVKWALSGDGYTLLFNTKGYLEYAKQNNEGDLVPTGIVAKDLNNRSLDEKLFLSKIQKGLKYSISQRSAMKSLMQVQENEIQKTFPSTGSRKLICILMGFQDKAFTKTQSDFNNLLNQVGYSLDGAAGSVKDYYLENSYNQFTLSVDIAGPFTASENMEYYGGNDINDNDLRPREFVTEAVNLANASVNYANYDNDNDGSVDAVYVIYAGYGEEAGGGANTIWAHAWNIFPTVTLDGKTISKYSCSPELRSNSGLNITRIGVICHEFGHVLGAPDYYDTDNDESGGDYKGTGNWDLMASGSWNNGGATPAHHNAYTKVYIYNWASATLLSFPNTIILDNAEENSNSFYRFNTSVTGDFFIMENRHKIGFDASIPGEGLIIYHHHTDFDLAKANGEINVTHPQKFYPVCANAGTNPGVLVSSYGNINSNDTPFPGAGSKTSFTDATIPSAKSWSGSNTNKPLTNITRDGIDQSITLDFMGGIGDNPKNFTATAVSSSQIGLSWQLNAGRDVLLAWSSDNSFGTPATGVNYSAGNILPGGDTVIYAGNNTSFNHTFLESNTIYYYKIWTKTDITPTWSTGVTSVATTYCSDAITSFPFIEDFETGFLPYCWEIIDNEGGGQVWEFGLITGGMEGTDGDYAYLNSNNFGEGNTQNCDLVTQVFDFTTTPIVNVSFKHYFKNNMSESATFSYSVDNGANWYEVKRWTNETNNPVSFRQYFPELAGESQVKFKWNYTGTFGNFWCIDHIKISDDTIPIAHIGKLISEVEPTIDGEIDELWASADSHNIDLNFTGETPTLYSATWRGVYNDTALFILVEVSDNSFWPSWLSGRNDSISDKPELYIDVNEILDDGFGPVEINIGHYRFAPNLSETDPGTVHNINGASVADTWSALDASYIYEYKIPFSVLIDKNGYQLDPLKRIEIGFDVCIIDLDDGQLNRNRAVWSNFGLIAENLLNMDNAGIAEFITYEDEPGPINLTANIIDNYNVLLTWNTLERFENYDDFDLYFNNWTQYDLDGSDTYGGENFDFINEYYTGSFIIFNPSQTTPELTSISWQPHSGSKTASCFNASTTPNNDWLVSSQYLVKEGDKLTIWAKSVTDDYGLERIKIGISTTGNSTSDFVFISDGSYLSVPISWTKYKFDLSSYVDQSIYFAIQCVSDDAFVLMLDDISITDILGLETYSIDFERNRIEKPLRIVRQTAPEAGINVTNIRKTANKEISGYKIYRDGVEIALTTNKNYTDTSLSVGTYTYYVTNVYSNPIGESSQSDEVMVTIKLVDVPFTYNNPETKILIYPTPATDYINVRISGMEGNTGIEIFNTLGNVIFNDAVVISTGTFTGQISVSNFYKGVYFLKINNNNSIGIIRFIVE